MHSFESSWIYLAIECQEPGTVQLMLKFQSEKFQSSLLRHTKSSAALVTKKKYNHTNYKENYLTKLDKLDYSEEERKALLGKIEAIKQKRKQEILNNNTHRDIVAHNKQVPAMLSSQSEYQLNFIEKHKQALKRARENKEKILEEDYKQKLFNVNRKEIEENISLKLKAIKIVRLYMENRKARFVKIIKMRQCVQTVYQKFQDARSQWLMLVQKHLMALRIQRKWRKLMSKSGATIDIRHHRFLKHTFTLLCNPRRSELSQNEARDVIATFLENNKTKIQCTEAFTSWYNKIVKIQRFFKFLYKRKLDRFEVMKTYWTKVMEAADWYMLMNMHSDKKRKKMKQYELTRLDRIDEETKEEIIKEYLHCYAVDRYQNKKEFMVIINSLPTSMKRLALLKYSLQRLKNDEMTKIQNDSKYLETKVTEGLEELMKNKKGKTTRPKSNRRKHRNKKPKKSSDKEDEKGDLEREDALSYTLDLLDQKLYGLIVPEAGGLPPLTDMIKLMTFKL